ncbi:MAG TPA: hypothetical protein VJY41_05815 [Prolixibacteraceae bacterium]|nr:hypothetical protein [Prolixibacteraceae bacterium]
MKESIEMQNEFEEIIQELKKLKSTNESLLKFEEEIGTTAKKFNEVNQSAVELFQQTQVLIKSIDNFIEKYKGILDEQIDDLKREIRDLKKLLKELDLNGIIDAAKDEVIDKMNTKTEILLEKLDGLSSSLQNLSEKTDATQKLCAKEFPALSQKMEIEAAKIANDFIVPLNKDVEFVLKQFETINFPDQFKNINTKFEEVSNGIGYIQNEINILHQQSIKISGILGDIQSGQNENRKLLDIINQRIAGVEKQYNNVLSQMESNSKNQRVQFIIIIAVIIVSWIVLMLK